MPAGRTVVGTTYTFTFDYELRRTGYASDNGVFYLLQDHLKSSSAVIHQNGTLHGTRNYYLPFGGNRSGAFSTLTTKRFTGQYHESSLPGGEGLSYYNARWYDAKLGRFLSADTIVPKPDNPQTLNRFAYALNNPVIYDDPTGHCPICIVLVLAGAAFLMEGSVAQQPAGNYVNTPNNNNGRLGMSLIFGDFNDVATVFTGYDHISREPVPYFSQDWIKTSVFMLMPVASRSTTRVIARSQVIQAVGEVVQPYLGRIKAIAGENAIIGFRGSLARGTVGNRRKPTYGNPVNLDDFDIDAFIISDELRKQGQWGNQIEGLDELQQEMYEALRVRPEFQGLRKDGFGFRIFSREEAAKQFDSYELYFLGGKRD